MKLLLTSTGLTNKSIINSLLKLTEKPFDKTNLVFIPTAANAEPGDKGWLIDDLYTCKQLGFKSIDIVDFSAIPQDMWQPRMEQADILFFGGGNTFHLMYWVQKVGLKQLLNDWLKSKIYVGLSAGSMITTTNINLAQDQKIYSEEIGELKSNEGLGLVNFQIRPHLNSPWFPKVRVEYLTQLAKEVKEPFYVIDDDTAIQVVDDKVSVISEGKWQLFNNSC